jgi:hypothetical protein
VLYNSKHELSKRQGPWNPVIGPIVIRSVYTRIAIDGLISVLERFTNPSPVNLPSWGITPSSLGIDNFFSLLASVNLAGRDTVRNAVIPSQLLPLGASVAYLGMSLASGIVDWTWAIRSLDSSGGNDFSEGRYVMENFISEILQAMITNSLESGVFELARQVDASGRLPFNPQVVIMTLYVRIFPP